MAALTALLPPAHISRHLLAPVASILGLGFIAHRIALFLPPPVDQQASTRKFLKVPPPASYSSPGPRALLAADYSRA